MDVVESDLVQQDARFMDDRSNPPGGDPDNSEPSQAILELGGNLALL